MEQKNELAVRLGRKVRAIRVLRGINLHELSVICNMSNLTISDIEMGKGNFNFTSIAKIEEALKCTLILVPNEDLE